MDYKPRKKKSDKKKEKEGRYGKFNSKHIRNRMVSEQVVDDKTNSSSKKKNSKK